MKPFPNTFLSSLCAISLHLSLFSLPKEGHVISGSSSIELIDSQHLEIKTSHQTILNWKEFSIGPKETVQFIQPSSQSSVLNRVGGSDPSHILGQLKANGKVYLINPNGILIGKDAIIQAADFLASTHDCSDNAFLQSQEILFQGDSKEAIINYGTIRALEGNVTLLARLIENDGTITAEKGAVLLGAGQEILLKCENTPLLTIRPFSEPDGKIDHKGRIEALTTELTAEGQAYARGINIEGTILALNTIEENGKIYLTSEGITLSPSSELNAKDGVIALYSNQKEIYLEGKLIAEQGLVTIQTTSGASLDHLGLIDVSGLRGGSVHIDTSKFIHAGNILAEGRQTEGGKVEIFTHGPVIETSRALTSVNATYAAGSIYLQADTTLFSSATHLAQGETGGTITLLSPTLTLVSAECNTTSSSLGGNIFIGGGPYGTLQNGPNAQTTQLVGNTKLLSDATDRGNGGVVVVFSEGKNVCHGTISANAGRESGNGGWIEVSGKDALYCGAALLANAPNGTSGQVLLDPKNIVIDAVNGLYPQYEFINPNPGGGGTFGTDVVVLSTGNVVITNSEEDSNKGAVYLFNGQTAELISTLRGSTANDGVGSSIQVLTNGNYVVLNPNWDNGANTNAGAVTWSSGTTGVEGLISSTNSLVGTSTNDQVGLNGVTTLSNGNYIVKSSSWKNGAATNAGAVTWGSGTTGMTGAVSSLNSLVGTQTSDAVGSGGVAVLGNDNYVILSPGWDNGATSNVGAVTWQNGTLPITGTISSANSLIGTTTNDRVGNGGIIPLTNDNYVVSSYLWNNGAFTIAGAATWCDGTTGLTGAVSTANSLTSDAAGTRVSIYGIQSLTNGNYVVISADWSSGSGAVTWCNGVSGTTGIVNTTNSLVGTTSQDLIGVNGITPLTNGNYVVGSSSWDNAGQTRAGALTWGDGTIGITGAVSITNSLVGTTIDDQIGTGNVVALSNGHYVASNFSWQNGIAANAGAATWGNGTTGITGAVSIANSLIGTQASDFVGSGIIALENGNYVVGSIAWANGANANAGAVTWGNGTTGITGTVSIANSLVGTQANNFVGGGIYGLANGNYVIRSARWENNGITNAGAATWGDGTTGITGTISASNSLVGTQANDFVSDYGIIPLTNGNYVVVTPDWNNQGVTQAGAVTWGDGVTGTTGAVSTSNSLVGTATADQIGIDHFTSTGVIPTTDGNYLITSSFWDNGAFTDAGALTFGNGTVGTTGAVSPQNSVVGQSASTTLELVIEDAVNETFLGRFSTEDGGRVRIGLESLNQITFSRWQAQTMTIAPSVLTTTLNLGTPVVLQANNDIEITSPISSNPGAGDLTLSAGKTISLNADITTGNSSLTVTANDLLSSGIVDSQRDAGAADLIVGNGVTIDTGAGNLTLSLLNGAGKTNATSGNVIIGDNATLQASSSGQISITAQENDIELGTDALLETVNGNLMLIAGKNIVANSAATIRTTGTGELFLISDNLFPTPPLFGTGCVNLPQTLLSTNGGRLLIYTSQRSLNTVPATINGLAYIAGPEFIDSTTEKWGTYYPNSSGIPFTIFYKEGNSSVINVPLSALYALVISVADSFNTWMTPWFNDLYFANDPYPPYLTQKGLYLMPSSLLSSQQERPFDFLLKQE